MNKKILFSFIGLTLGATMLTVPATVNALESKKTTAFTELSIAVADSQEALASAYEVLALAAEEDARAASSAGSEKEAVSALASLEKFRGLAAKTSRKVTHARKLESGIVAQEIKVESCTAGIFARETIEGVRFEPESLNESRYACEIAASAAKKTASLFKKALSVCMEEAIVAKLRLAASKAEAASIRADKIELELNRAVIEARC